jgi:hypothetical protein
MAGIQATILRMINEAKSTLPFEELCSDVLRDGETVYVVLSGDDGRWRRGRARKASN